MTSPLQGSGPRSPAVRLVRGDRRRTLARKWAYLLSLNSYLALPHAEMERELEDLVTHVFDAMTSEPMPVDLVAGIGARLVELHGVGKASLRCTMDVLAGALLSDPDVARFERLPERVTQLLGALASGYVDAIQASTMEQQDSLHRALLEFTWESEQRQKAAEARLDAVLDGSASGIGITDLDGRLVRGNPVLSQLLPDGCTVFDLVPFVELRELLDGKRDRLALRPGGETSLTASLVRDDDGKASEVVTIIADDTRLAQLNHQVLHDAVTGLPNHECFSARLSQTLRTGKPITLYELELDGFP